MSEALLGPKLETAFVAWVNANKAAAGLLSGITVQDAHGSAEPKPPYISVWCSRAPVHPDFQGINGGILPRRAFVEFFVKGRSTAGGAGFAATVGQWAGELEVLLTRHRAVTFTANAGTEVLTSAAHLIADGALVRLTSTGTLPGGLSAGVDYFTRDTTSGTLKLSATQGGAVVDITSAGSGTHTLTVPVDFSDLMAGCNLGGTQHPSSGLKIFGMCLLDQGAGVEGDCWVASLQLEVDAENVDRS